MTEEINPVLGGEVVPENAASSNFFKCVLAIIFMIVVQPRGYGMATVLPDDLRCDYRISPQGIDIPNPQLSWILQARVTSQRNLSQSAYQILVANKDDRLVPGKADLWESGKIISGQMTHIPYHGKPLQSFEKCWWAVRVWDQNGQPSQWSKPASWTMGPLSSADWKAKWIAASGLDDPATPLPLFRKEFVADKSLSRALACVCGLGFYELHLNGKKVGDAVLDPGWTDYRKTCLYNVYDVTRLIRRGKNVLGVLLGNGMYNIAASHRYAKFTGSFGPPRFVLQLHLEFADGTATDIVTDPSWRTAPGPITFSSIYGGEDYDARRAEAGWDRPGFSDAQWPSVIAVPGPGGELTAQSAPPIKIMHLFRPMTITEPKPGVFVYDFGQEFSGWPQIIVRGPAGATVRLVPGELLTPDGLVDQRASGRPVWFAYTLKGSGGREIWQPRFSYYGFRYIQVEGAVPAGRANRTNRRPVIFGLAGCFTHSAAPVSGQFECSDTLINRVHALILGAIDSNLQSILTDCPHREKLGWLECAHLLGPAIMFDHDAVTLWRKICNDTADAQQGNGLVPDIAPEYTRFSGPYRDSPEWGSACVICPWLLYQYYGESNELIAHYQTMCRYVNYLGSRATNHIISYGLGDWLDIGPVKPGGESQLTSKGLAATAIYYEDLGILCNAARMLGHTNEAGKWEQLRAEVRNDFNHNFFNPVLHQYDRNSQTADAMPLALGLVEPADARAVAENLAENVRAGDNQVTAGDIGFRFLIQALRESGHSDAVYDLVTHRDGPGYAMQLAKGCTTLAEVWDASSYSRDHCMLGHAEEWFYTGLAGINPDPAGPAFRKIIVAPQPVGDVTWARGSYDSISGRISSSWKIADGQFSLSLSIPPNTTATVRIPAGDTAQVKENGRALQKVSGVRSFGTTNSEVIIQIGSGDYCFTSPWANQQSISKRRNLHTAGALPRGQKIQ